MVFRTAIRDIQQANEKLKYGSYPPRKDGGYGWFIVQETEDELENLDPSSSGCNNIYDHNDSSQGMISYFWLGKYWNNELYRQGMNLIFSTDLIREADNGQITKKISDDNLATLIELNLVKRENDQFYLTIPTFTAAQFNQLLLLLDPLTSQLKEQLKDLVNQIWLEFHSFVPKQVQDQINQYLAGYIHNIIGLVIFDMIDKGYLASPPKEGPLAYGVFSVGKTLNF